MTLIGGRLVSVVGLSLFVFGLALAVLIFVDVQLLNGVYHFGNTVVRFEGYPWWGERISVQSCFLGSQPDLNCGFINYGQGLVILLLLSFSGFYVWQARGDSKLNTRGRRVRGLGLSLLFFGLLIAFVVFVEVQVMNSIYHIGALTFYFQGFPYGGEQVFGGSCMVGSDQYSCALFSYDELLFSSAVAAFLGFVLVEYQRSRGTTLRQGEK